MTDIVDVLWRVHNDPGGGHEAALADVSPSFDDGVGVNRSSGITLFEMSNLMAPKRFAGFKFEAILLKTLKTFVSFGSSSVSFVTSDQLENSDFAFKREKYFLTPFYDILSTKHDLNVSSVSFRIA